MGWNNCNSDGRQLFRRLEGRLESTAIVPKIDTVCLYLAEVPLWREENEWAVVKESGRQVNSLQGASLCLLLSWNNCEGHGRQLLRRREGRLEAQVYSHRSEIHRLPGCQTIGAYTLRREDSEWAAVKESERQLNSLHGASLRLALG